MAIAASYVDGGSGASGMLKRIRKRLSLLRAMILTALGFPRGFFIQYKFARHVPPVTVPYPEVESLCERSDFRGFLRDVGGHVEAFRGFGESPGDPVWTSLMFSPLDGMAAYAAVRRYRPRRIVEIGCGDSTKFLARAVRDNGEGQVTCVDPEPRRSIEELGVEFRRRMLSTDDLDLAAGLQANDVLFIDSSHIMLPGMDVDIQFNRMFPRLAPGVLVHIHDIFLPDDYKWAGRYWSEQNALIGWLISGYFEILYPGRYVLTRYPDLIRSELGAVGADLNFSGSLWLRRT